MESIYGYGKIITRKNTNKRMGKVVMKKLIRNIIKEESPLDNSDYGDYHIRLKGERNVPSKKVFFSVVKHLAVSNPVGIFDMAVDVEDRAHEMEDTLKLFGISIDDDTLLSRIYYAVLDNRAGLIDGTINMDNLPVLRQLIKYRLTCEEHWTENTWYTWKPEVEAFSEEDAVHIVDMDEDGYYNYWEWESYPGFDRESGDSDSDGKEVTEVVEIENPATGNDIIKENESPEDNELVDGLRSILKKQKESNSEDVWYGDITKLLKKLDIPLN